MNTKDVRKQHWRKRFSELALTEANSIARADFVLAKGAQELRRSIGRLIGQPRGLKILDAGCGDGEVTRSFTQNNEVTGLDQAPEILELAAAAGLQPHLGDLERPPFKPVSFDMVISVEAIGYASEPLQALRALARLVSPQGRLVLSCVNRASIMRKTAAIVDRYRGHFCPQELVLSDVVQLLEAENFDVQQRRLVFALPGCAASVATDHNKDWRLRLANNIQVAAVRRSLN